MKTGVRNSVKASEIAAAVRSDLTRTILPDGRRGTAAPPSSTTSPARVSPVASSPVEQVVRLVGGLDEDGLAVPRALRDRRRGTSAAPPAPTTTSCSMPRRTASRPTRSCSSPADSPSSLIAPSTATVRSPGPVIWARVLQRGGHRVGAGVVGVVDDGDAVGARGPPCASARRARRSRAPATIVVERHAERGRRRPRRRGRS